MFMYTVIMEKSMDGVLLFQRKLLAKRSGRVLEKMSQPGQFPQNVAITGDGSILQDRTRCGAVTLNQQ
jgi:hypothetical protein